MSALPRIIFQASFPPEFRLYPLDIRTDLAIARFEQAGPGQTEPLLLREIRTATDRIDLNQGELRLADKEINQRPGTIGNFFANLYPETLHQTRARVLFASQALLMPLLREESSLILPQIGAARCLDRHGPRPGMPVEGGFIPLFDRDSHQVLTSAHMRLTRIEQLRDEISLLVRIAGLPDTGPVILSPQQQGSVKM